MTIEQEAHEVLSTLPSDLSSLSNEALGKAYLRIEALRHRAADWELLADLRHAREMEQLENYHAKYLVALMDIAEDEGVDLTHRRATIEGMVSRHKSDAARLRLVIHELEQHLRLPKEVLPALRNISAEIARRSE